MKKLIIAVILISSFIVSCDDNESRYPGTLLQQAFHPECIENEAMCFNNIGYKCSFGRYRIVAPCSLQGNTCTLDTETCGGEFGETVCCE